MTNSDEPYVPADEPTLPAQPVVSTTVAAADGTAQSSVPAGKDADLAADQTAPKTPGKTKRLLQFGAVGVAGLVAGSALTFAVTANGNVTGSNSSGPGSGQFGGPGGGRGGGGYGEGRGGRPPGQNSQGQNSQGQNSQDGSTDQGRTNPSTQPSTQDG